MFTVRQADFRPSHIQSALLGAFLFFLYAVAKSAYFSFIRDCYTLASLTGDQAMALRNSLPTTPIESQSEPQIHVPAANHALLGKLYLPHDQIWADIGRVIFLIPGIIPRGDRLTDFLVMLELPRETPIILAELTGTGHSHPSKQTATAKLVAWMQREYAATRHMTIQAATWLEAMATLVEEHDLLISFVGVRTETGPFGEQSLSQALFDRFNLPTLEIAGALPGWSSRFKGWIKRALFELFPYLVVGLFFWVQVEIGKQGEGPLTNIKIGLTIMFEMALVFVWSLFVS